MAVTTKTAHRSYCLNLCIGALVFGACGCKGCEVSAFFWGSRFLSLAGCYGQLMCQFAKALTSPQLSHRTPAWGLFWQLFVDVVRLTNIEGKEEPKVAMRLGKPSNSPRALRAKPEVSLRRSSALRLQPQLLPVSRLPACPANLRPANPTAHRLVIP